MENYYDNSSRWVFDSDGNYLHSKRKTYNPNLHREGIFFSDSKKEEDSSEIEGWDEGFDLDLDLESSTISKKEKDSSEIEGWDEGFDLDLY